MLSDQADDDDADEHFVPPEPPPLPRPTRAMVIIALFFAIGLVLLQKSLGVVDWLIRRPSFRTWRIVLRTAARELFLSTLIAPMVMMRQTVSVMSIFAGNDCGWKPAGGAKKRGDMRWLEPVAGMALIGAVNLPVVKFSVEWWNTLHQPASVTKLDAPSMHVDILYPLLVCALGFTLAFAALVLARTRAAVMERRIRALQLAAARRAELPPDGRSALQGAEG